MNIEEKIEFLRKKHPKFSRRVMHDVDDKGNEFCEIIYPNDNNPMMPIAVSVSDEGCLISVGKYPNVTGDYPITVEQACSAIDDVINDRIVFVFGYEDIDDEGGAPFMTEIFPITGMEDDESEELENLTAIARRKVGKGQVIILGSAIDKKSLLKLVDKKPTLGASENIDLTQRLGEENGIIAIEIEGKDGYIVLDKEYYDVLADKKISGRVEMKPYDAYILKEI